MSSYNDDNYMLKLNECLNEGEEFGEHATDMINIFSEPPDFNDYSPDSEMTKSIAQYYTLNADLGGETFFMVNK